MGGFTTFSAFMLETGGLLQDSEWLWATGNVLAHNVLGIGIFFLGLMLGRYI
jgi:CrcB protein